jgi:hypothetical protein
MVAASVAAGSERGAIGLSDIVAWDPRRKAKKTWKWAIFCDYAPSRGCVRIPMLTFHCSGATPVIDELSLAPEGPGGPLPPIGPGDTVRLVTNDCMFTGGDGYTALVGASHVLTPGDGLLEVTIEYIAAGSPVAPVVEGRIVRGPPG